MLTAMMFGLLLLAPQNSGSDKAKAPAASAEKQVDSPKKDNADKSKPAEKPASASRKNPTDDLLPKDSGWGGSWDTNYAQAGACRSIRVTERTANRAVLEIEAENKSKWTFVLEFKHKQWAVTDVRHERASSGGTRKIDGVKPGRVSVKDKELSIVFEFQLANKTNKGTITAKRL